MAADYKEKIKEKYSDGREAARVERNGAYPMEFIYTKRALDPYIDASKRVIEIGCGGGYYLMHYAPKCKEYIGVDLSPVNIQMTQEQITAKEYENADAMVGDATNLENIADESFDVVLCLGPLYHLKREDRKQCIAECKRICKSGGIIVFAFINKIGAIAKYGAGASWADVLTQDIGQSVLEHGVDKKNEDVFFFTSPEEIIEDTAACGLKKIRMTGVDFLLLEETIETFTDKQRRIWFQFADAVADSEYAAALSNHALLICER